MSNLISRQAAIDKVDRIVKVNHLNPDMVWFTPNGVKTLMGDLPSAEPDDEEANYWHEKANSYEQTLVKLAQSIAEQPERKKGRWIPQEAENGDPYGDKCSECGEWYVMPEGKTNYCPNWGAWMEGER